MWITTADPDHGRPRQTMAAAHWQAFDRTGPPPAPAVSVSIIGSFRQHYPLVVHAAQELAALGISVRSPKICKIINPGGEYARFETDPPETPDQLIQAVTLAKILSSDLVYVVAPGGYVGRTTCYELGRIHERSIPVYYSAMPRDLPIEIPAGSVLCVHDLGRKILARPWYRHECLALGN